MAAIRAVQTPLAASTAHVGRDIVLTVVVSYAMVSLLMYTPLLHIHIPFLYITHTHIYSTKRYSLVDIDECQEESDNCSQICLNNDGSYTCDCNVGYELGSDQQTCSGELSILVRIFDNAMSSRHE